MKQSFLMELGTEELPPKALKKLIAAFAGNVEALLKKASLSHGNIQSFATPRRLALLIADLDDKQADKQVERKGPAVKAAFDADGKPTQACLGFARSCGVDVNDLQKIETDKGDWLVHLSNETGKTIAELMPSIIQKALGQLPIPKRMRWGDHTSEFIRPVHWAVLLYGDTLIDATFFESKTDRITYGHRFHHPEPIVLKTAIDYEASLEKTAHVIPAFEKRQSLIQEKITLAASKVNAKAVIDQDLLEEVTGLVEWPIALCGNFDERFLDVPPEALISSMKTHQKCFPLVDQQGKLKPHFITISNIQSKDEQQVIAGNERVIRARLKDAEFFYLKDLQHPLESHFDTLKHIVYQKQLGTLYEKSERITSLAKVIAQHINVDVSLTERASMLCKTDLVSEMVGEFPELQGTMGYYYATKNNEPAAVATALKDYYLPRFSRDSLPTDLISATVAIADRLDTLVGIIGIGKTPTGEKDPFGLKRAALAVLRIIIEKQLPLDLYELLILAHQAYADRLTNKEVVDETFTFILDRLKAWYQDRAINTDVFAAVMAKKPRRPLDFDHRINAVTQFQKLPEAAALAAANKRVSKLLLKESQENIDRAFKTSLLQNDAEKTLAKLIQEKQKELQPFYHDAEYNKALTALATLRDPIDHFFDEVMVMVDDESLRNNRLSLLANLRDLFLEIADISVLQN